MKKTDREWDFYGRTDPYYGVLTSEDYRYGNLDAAGLARFFESGQHHIEAVFNVVKSNLAPSFHPKRALDFGCGVGRLVIPLASKCEMVVGADVSPAMLDEARANCLRRGIVNVDFYHSNDQLTGLMGNFDFIHSYIVFQHIPCTRGETILGRLLDVLGEGGIGVLHFTYLRRFHKYDRAARLLDRARQSSVLLNGMINLARNRPFRYPRMALNEYNLNSVLHILEDHSCHNLAIRFTRDSSPYSTAYGVLIFCQRTQPTYWQSS